MPVWALYLGGAVMLTTTGFISGWTVRDWKADSEELADIQAGIELGKQQQELADYRAGRYEEYRDEREAAIRERDTEIRTIYRTEQVEVPVECEPPAGALRVLDDALRDANAQVTGQSGPTLPSTSSETYPIY